MAHLLYVTPCTERWLICVGLYDLLRLMSRMAALGNRLVCVSLLDSCVWLERERRYWKRTRKGWEQRGRQIGFLHNVLTPKYVNYSRFDGPSRCNFRQINILPGLAFCPLWRGLDNFGCIEQIPLIFWTVSAQEQWFPSSFSLPFPKSCWTWRTRALGCCQNDNQCWQARLREWLVGWCLEVRPVFLMQVLSVQSAAPQNVQSICVNSKQ